MSIYTVTTDSGKTYNVVTWTGGDTPMGVSETGSEWEEYRKLRRALFRQSLKSCGKLDDFKFSKPIWPDENGNAQNFELIQFEKLGYYGTGCVERARIFWNEAKLNAWRTLKTHKALNK